MDPELLSLLNIEVSKIGAPLTFAPSEKLPAFEGFELPAETFMWKSTFAVLLVIPVHPATSERLQQTSKAGGEWMWHFLDGLERKGTFLDGYVVFAFETKPTENLATAIRDLEADSKICRKHAVWPEGKSWIPRLHYVTTLGLPSVAESVVQSEKTKMPALATKALRLYSERKSYEAAATQLREDVENSALTDTRNAD